MAHSDANGLPIQGQALRIPVSFRTDAGALITTWNTPTSIVSNDGSTSVAGPTPVEIGTTGMGYIDLSADIMDSPLVQIVAQVLNADAVKTDIAIFTYNTDDDGTRSFRLERMLAQLWRRWFNKATDNGSALVVQKDNDTDPMVTGAIATTGTTTTRNRLA